ncbi:MAG: MBL fold metallo-hydrolase [Acidiferrobacterales bacterium]|nr:MBL fold metallo-hydrolase [Acidiferrobacterales bacterium]
MELEFFGAAGEVTGSCHIVRVNGRQFLLDCGMIQGNRKQEQRNREPFPFNPEEIDAVVLSHAHIDHSGRLPLLVKRGFNGPIYTHNATKDLCGILLEDSASLAQRDAEYANRKRPDKPPIEPLYSIQDARQVLRFLKGSKYNQKIEILPGVEIRFQDAGHIIGSTSVELWLREGEVRKKIVFSGDLGQYDTPILHDPAVIEEADLVLMESTYGGRTHRERSLTHDEIGEIVSEAHHGKGNILIPAFAIGRSQEVLYTLGTHYEEWKMSRWHVFLDSPMAIKASEVYWDYPHLYDDEATKFRRELHEMPRLKNLHLTSSTEESMVINKVTSGGIIIAGSGMCNGGRIRHHLRHNLSRPECHVVIVGYQSPGTLGRRLVDGEEEVRIKGQWIRVQAKIHTVGGLSAHGDEDDLVRWFRGFVNKPPVYLVHGETKSARALEQKLQNEAGTRATVADSGAVIDLTKI